jgi:hypothetical protein
MRAWIEAFVDSHTAVALRVRGPILDLYCLPIYGAEMETWWRSQILTYGLSCVGLISARAIRLPEYIFIMLPPLHA